MIRSCPASATSAAASRRSPLRAAITEKRGGGSALLGRGRRAGPCGNRLRRRLRRSRVWQAYAIEVNLRSGGTTIRWRCSSCCPAAPTTPTRRSSPPMRLAAALRRDRLSRVAAAAGARPGRPAAARRAAAAGGGWLRRRLPHAERDRRARPRRTDRDRHDGRGRAEPFRAGAGAAARRRRGVRRSLICRGFDGSVRSWRSRSPLAAAARRTTSRRTGAPASHAEAEDHRGRGGRALAVPVLCYHQIRTPTGADSAADRQYIVSPSALDKQLQALADAGYTPISGTTRRHGAWEDAAAQADPAHLRRRLRRPMAAGAADPREHHFKPPSS